MKSDIVLIRKNIFLIQIVFILFFFLTSKTYSNIQDNEIDFSSEKYCEKIKFHDSFNKINSIEIIFDNYRGWAKNSLRILTNQSKEKFIPGKFKRRYPANIIVYYSDDNICDYRASIRQSGDLFDHIKLNNGNIIQSLDVHLDKGNILGVTKFKLFLPSTRNAHSEIVVSKLLKDLGYISPKSFLVDVFLNEKKINYFFQEKTSKELIESSNFKDAPIYEGNENLIVGTHKNQNIIFNKKLTFSKQVNSKWIQTDLTREISIEGMTKLNEVFFKNISFFSKPNHKIDQLTLDYSLLSNQDQKHFNYLIVYDALINSVNGGHSLLPHNRKFYFEPYSKKFYPIFYDSSPGSMNRSILGGWEAKIKKLKKDEFKWGVSKNSILGANLALIRLKSLNTDKIYNELKLYGMKYNQSEFNEIIDSIKNNLITISKIPFEPKDDYIKSIHDYLNFSKKDSIEFATFYSFEKELYVCENNENKCLKTYLDRTDFQKLINGEFIYNQKKSLYLGDINQDLDNIKIVNFKKYKEKEVVRTNYSFENNFINIKSTKNLNINIDDEKKIIQIQADTDDWLVIEDSILNDIEIKLIYNDKKNNILKEDRFNKYFLTGCLNIIDSNLNNVRINIQNAKCEDAINIIKSKGNISLIEIYNSLFDGLDLDFSNININQLSVSHSGNDCSDFSFGNYKIDELNLSNCGDKGVSIGERTNAGIENMNIINSNIGLASKDSSIVNVTNALIKNTKFCISAYNKKNEFDGGRVNVNKFKCEISNEKIAKDQYSLININHEL